MARHRLREMLERPVEAGLARSSAISVDGFIVCPLAVQQWVGERACQWDVYQQAWQQALELARPSILDRCQAVSWN